MTCAFPRLTLLVAALSTLLAGCGGARAALSDTPAADATPRAETRDLARHFNAFGARGAFVVHHLGANRVVRHDPARAAARFRPASTFKIFNTLVALDAGAVRDEHEVLPWDGVDRFGNADWNRDHAIATAFQASAVWFYQELARRVGPAVMEEWIRRVGYGNQDLSGAPDEFWLTGGLALSADEQVAFLRRLHAGTLPFSQRAQRITREVMLLEATDAYTLRGKTGWSRGEGLHRGWLVGWVERDGDVHVFATQIESDDARFPMRRAQQEITRGILAELGLI
jgi:beta-lactamase class D